MGTVEAEVLAEFHAREAILGVGPRVLVNPGHGDVEETCGIVNGGEFIADRPDLTVTMMAPAGGLWRTPVRVDPASRGAVLPAMYVGLIWARENVYSLDGDHRVSGARSSVKGV